MFDSFFIEEDPVVVEEDGENLDGCEADSLDSAIDPEEHKAPIVEDDDEEYIDSIVFKGKKIKKGSGLHSHHFSSVGNLLQVSKVCNEKKFPQVLFNLLNTIHSIQNSIFVPKN